MKEHHAAKAKKEVVHRHHHPSNILGMSRVLFGIILVVIALLLSYLGEKLGGGAQTLRAVFGALLLYCIVLAVRFVFLALSSKILKLTDSSWKTSLVTVGANAVFMTALTTFGQVARLTSLRADIIFFVISVVVAFIVGMKAYRISFLETLALYALSLAMFVVAFVAVVFFFHASLAGILPAGALQ